MVNHFVTPVFEMLFATLSASVSLLWFTLVDCAELCFLWLRGPNMTKHQKIFQTCWKISNGGRPEQEPCFLSVAHDVVKKYNSFEPVLDWIWKRNTYIRLSGKTLAELNSHHLFVPNVRILFTDKDLWRIWLVRCNTVGLLCANIPEAFFGPSSTEAVSLITSIALANACLEEKNLPTDVGYWSKKLFVYIDKVSIKITGTSKWVAYFSCNFSQHNAGKR